MPPPQPYSHTAARGLPTHTHTRHRATAAVATDNTLRLLQAAGFDAGSDLIVAQGLPWPTSEGRHWGKSFDDIFPATSQKASPTPAHEVLVAKALSAVPGAVAVPVDARAQIAR